MSEPLRKRLRALTASIAATALDVVTLLALVRVAHVTAGLAAAAGCIAGGALNFVLSRRWVFAARGRSATRQLAAYGVLVVLGSAVMAGVLVHAGTALLGAPILAAKATAAALVFVTWTYPVSERVVFRKELA